jgi:hypothetical protein
MAMATSTRLAPIAEFVPPFDRTATPEALRALEQDPFGDAREPRSPGATKRALLASIAGSKSSRRAAYVAMRREIESARTEHARELAELRARVDANREASRAAALAADRTWPFPMTVNN